MATLIESLSHKPVELSFGTSGLRGLVTDMTDIECYINTLGFLDYVERTGESAQTIYIAGDLRASTPRILRAVLAAAVKREKRVCYFGLVPTPTIALQALKDTVPCIMVTGSHIPADRNGIKFYKADGEILKADEQGIKEAVAKVRAALYKSDFAESGFGVDGNLLTAQALPDTLPDAVNGYISNFTNVFSGKPFDGKQVVVYQHSAVGRDLLVRLLTDLGAEVIAEGRSEVFIPIDTENVTPDDQAYFLSLAQKHPSAFAIVSTDGDSDRPFMIDEKGIFHRGDELGAVVAEVLNADAAAFPVSSNDNIDPYLGENSVSYTRTRIGSPYVIVEMQKEVKAGKRRVVGWEVNGGFMLGTDIPFANGVLHRLPTRDAFLPLLVTIYEAIQKKSTVSDVFKKLPARFTQAGLIDDFPVVVSQEIVAAFQAPDARKLIQQYFTRELGFGEVVDINTLDGVRITFDNGDIAHLRPSGNAPQLRIYSVASTQERANDIVTMAIAEPNGIFRQLESMTRS